MTLSLRALRNDPWVGGRVRGCCGNLGNESFSSDKGSELLF